MSLRPATRADLDRIRGVQAEWWGGRDLTALLQPLFLENFASTSLIQEDDDGALAELGNYFLMRQAVCIGGGTTEMAANVISERVLGMPREQTLDKDLPFRDVPRSRNKSP